MDPKEIAGVDQKSKASKNPPSIRAAQKFGLDFWDFFVRIGNPIVKNHGFSSKTMDGHQNPLGFYWKLEWDFSGEWDFCVT